MTSVSHLIDHTLLAPDARTADIDRLCREAVEIGAASVCVNPVHVARCAESLREEDVKVCAVIAFPFGASLSGTKACETRAAVRDGAQEVDMVLNLGAAKDGEWDVVGEDVRAVVEAAGPGTVVKVILETCLLTDDEIVLACQSARDAGAHFVKTSTGYSTHGATVHAVALMRRTVGESMGIKASGGIRTPEDLAAMVEAGATRIGASTGRAQLDEEARA